MRLCARYTRQQHVGNAAAVVRPVVSIGLTDASGQHGDEVPIQQLLGMADVGQSPVHIEQRLDWRRWGDDVKALFIQLADALCFPYGFELLRGLKQLFG